MKDGYSAYKAYDKDTAENYESDRVVEELWDKEQEFICDFVSNLKPGTRILDIPVGTGRFLKYYEGFEVVGIDISKEMLQVAGKKISDLPQLSIDLRTGDITKLELEDRSIDYTICWRICHLLPEHILIKGIEEICRVTNFEVIVQTFDTRIRSLPERISSKLTRVSKRVFGSDSSGQGQESKWSHIKNYAHGEKAIMNYFEDQHFFMKEKTEIDFYNNGPVNVYVFERKGTHI